MVSTTEGEKMLLPSSWGAGGLSSIFAESYTKPIASYYPYTSARVTPPSSTATGMVGTHANLSSGTEPGQKTILAVSICVGVTCISFLIWLATRRLARHRAWIKSNLPDSTRENIATDPRIYKQDSDCMIFSASGAYRTDEKSSRPQIALLEKTYTEFTPTKTQLQVDPSLIFELESELFHYNQLEHVQGANSNKHVTRNASNCHPTSARSHRGVLQRTLTRVTSRFVHRKHSDGHKQSRRPRQFKTLQPDIKPNHRLRVHCQRLLDFHLSMDASTDGGAFL